MIIYPPHTYLTGWSGPPSDTIFLAGPIQGAWAWQERAIKFLQESGDASTLLIANPKRPYFAKDPSEGPYDQINWETHWLNKAAKTGCILFWLAKEEVHIPERAYAQTTRWELSEWVERTRHNLDLRIVIGIEPGFSGEKYIRYRVGNQYPIHTTLRKTVAAAVAMARHVSHSTLP